MEMLQALSSRFGLVAIPLAIALFTLSGCGGGKEIVPVGSVSGTVKSDGEICGDCLMAVFNPQTKRSRSCRVGESGTYELKDLPFGDYEITMVQKPTNEPIATFDKRIPKKYRDIKTSGLRVSIVSEEPVVYDIEMN